ncbi:hypothetical protein VUR80DRAFT_8052 [Thermomyces stellatus]
MYSLRAHTISRHLATSLSAPAAIRNPVLRRKMATTAEGKYNWIVIVPDKPGTLAKRLEVRAQHMAGVKKHEASGAVKVGGAIFSEPPQGNDPSKWAFCGSTLNVVAETKDEVVDLLRSDIYATSGVWDVDKAQIYPAVLAFRHE